MTLKKKKTYIDNDRHATIVEGLGAVRPHVGSFCQVNVVGAGTDSRKINKL